MVAKLSFHKSESPPRGVLAIRAERLSKDYGSTAALRDLSLEVPDGGFVGLLGPNGSGKTTSIHCLTTLVQPTGGRAQVAGHDVRTDGTAVRREIGLLFQEPALDPALTVDETLAFAGALRSLSRRQSRQRANELLELFQLTSKRRARVGTLSGGTKRALDIARSVLHRPRILFLDEPTLGLDVPNRRSIWDHIQRLRREEGATVFFSTHYLEEAEGCDEVYFLADGRIVGRGAPHDLAAQLGQSMLEIEGEDIAPAIDLLSKRLGPCFRQGERALFRMPSDSTSIDRVLGTTGGGLRSVCKRRPTLNDVFVWITDPNLREEIA